MLKRMKWIFGGALLFLLVLLVVPAVATTINEFPVPTATAFDGNWPAFIVAGPDGNLWFTETSANKIGRITTAGVIAEFPIPTAGSFPWGLLTGLDGNLGLLKRMETRSHG